MEVPAKKIKPAEPTELDRVRESATGIVSTNLVRIRESRELDRKQVARMLSRAEVTLWQWENGKRLPSVRELLALSRIYDVTPDAFFEPTPYCPNCDIYYSNAHYFCSHCGFKLQ